MATTPTQMRLTETDLARLDRIKRLLRCKDRTATVREMLGSVERWAELPTIKIKSKKSSVAT